MLPDHQKSGRNRPGPHIFTLAGPALLAGLVAATSPACAASFDTGSDVEVRLDTTVKYSAAIRTSDQIDSLLAQINSDDADRAFRAGQFISDRIDVLAELDIKYHNLGFNASAAGWYDTQYNRSNSNDSPNTFNGLSVDSNREFPEATSRIEGRKLELLNAYGYWNGHVDDFPVHVRAGRYTLVWGESLFAADNGIAYGQAPIDIIKASSVPSTQAKELFMPVSQISASTELAKGLGLEIYNQFEWRKSRLPAADSYFSNTDILDYGGERILFSPQPALPLPGAKDLAAYRGKDAEPTGLGQFGAALHYRPNSDFDLGLYALQYNDKLPQVYTVPIPGRPTFQQLYDGHIADYRLGYAKHIQLYGVSGSTTVGQVNYGAEISTRINNDLISRAITVLPGQNADFDHNPLYAVGNSLHYQVNAVWLVPGTPAFDSAVVLGELFGSHIYDITKNPENFSPDARHTTLGFRGLFDPTYYQVRPGLDIDFPIGLGWNFQGRSGTATVFNNTNAAYGGDFEAGVSFVYNTVWRGGLSYTRYIGGKAVANDGYLLSQYLDRDFVSFNIQRSF